MDKSQSELIREALADLARPHVEDELLPAIETIMGFLYKWYGDDINGFAGVFEILKQFLIDKFEEHRY